jgi:RIO kinase 1
VAAAHPRRRPRSQEWDDADFDDGSPAGPGIDTSDVRIERTDETTPVPDWVITGERLVTELGVVKTGKEAVVTCERWTERGLAGRSHLVAVKRYRPRAQRAFRREEVYREEMGINDERAARAVAKRTDFGRAILEWQWAARELPLLRRAWEAGVHVPYAIADIGDGLAMEYLGSEDGAAPRLVDAGLDADAAEWGFAAAVDDLCRLTALGLVHGDLSAYNVLWWADRPWIIDFPQAVDLVRSPRGPDLLARDARNLCAAFRRFGVAADPDEVLAAAWSAVPW